MINSAVVNQIFKSQAGRGTWFGQPQQTWSRDAVNRTGRETDAQVAAKYRGPSRGSVAAPGTPARRAPGFGW